MLRKDETIARCTSAAESANRLKQIIDRLQGEVTRLTDVAPTTQAVFQVAALREELEGMAVLISDTRSEVAGLLPAGMPHTRLASASDELYAVVGATETAAAEIMNAAEQIQEAAEELMEKAHGVCPYSKATRGNIDVKLSAKV